MNERMNTASHGSSWLCAFPSSPCWLLAGCNRPVAPSPRHGRPHSHPHSHHTLILSLATTNKTCLALQHPPTGKRDHHGHDKALAGSGSGPLGATQLASTEFYPSGSLHPLLPMTEVPLPPCQLSSGYPPPARQVSLSNDLSSETCCLRPFQPAKFGRAASDVSHARCSLLRHMDTPALGCHQHACLEKLLLNWFSATLPQNANCVIYSPARALAFTAELASTLDSFPS